MAYRRRSPRFYSRPADIQLRVLQALEVLMAEGPAACTTARMASASGFAIEQVRNAVIQLREKEMIVSLPLDGTCERGYWRTPEAKRA